jgi:predicted transcriptional regulator
MYICSVNNNKENKTTTITFRTSEDLKKRLEAMAAKDQRSLSNMIEFLLEKATEKKK